MTQRHRSLPTVVRRSVQTALLTGGLSALALELVGGPAAVAVATVTAAATPFATRPYRWPGGPGRSALNQVPTQRSAPPEA